MQYIAVQYTAVRYSAVQYTAVQYSAVHETEGEYTGEQYTAVQLQCSALHLSKTHSRTTSALPALNSIKTAGKHCTVMPATTLQITARLFTTVLYTVLKSLALHFNVKHGTKLYSLHCIVL
jgi:hypothetical protein